MGKANSRQTTGSIFGSKLAGRDFGKYRAVKLISKHESRHTITLQAINKGTNQRVVLKAFGSFSVKSKKEFEKEIAAFAKLESRHGVLIPLDTFEYEGDYFIVTEYKNGGDLRGWLKTKPKVAETLDIFTRIAESIDYVHEHKIIHRDIKPENIVYEVLDGRITPYLMDFGIAVTLSDKTSSFKTEHAFGTIEYMAPEFFLDVDAKKTKAVDIYAFGLMLYEALEGRHPFLGNTRQETIDQIISRVVPVPENTIKRLGESAGFMLTKALSKNPEERPKTATEIITQVGSLYIKYVGKAYGKYVIKEYLGRGLYGVTYKAYEVNNRGKKVALKLLTVSQAKKPEFSGLKELERGKGVLPIIDAGYENGVQYLASEYLNGPDLRHLLSPKSMEIRDILEILRPLSKALDYLHEKAIIHQDLKPENILLRKDKADGSLQPFISDYGVSKIAEAPDSINANGNVLLGSLNYLAPEILENKQPSPAADLYSLGVIIYEALEGKPPFDAKTLPALIKQKLDNDVPVPENLLKSGGLRAVWVLLKALNVKPGRRQSSASDLVSQLEDAINNQTFADAGIFTEPWVWSRKLSSTMKRISYASLVSGLCLFLILWGISSFLPARPTSSPTVIPTIPVVTRTPTLSPTPSPSATPTTLPVVSAPTFVLSNECRLPIDSLDHDYSVPGHLLLEDVYRKHFSDEPDSNDLYAIAYFNNRKILEGHGQYHAIDPVSLDARRDWKIFIPPQGWIDQYKEFPATIPQPDQIKTSSKLFISGSSILAHLSAQISKCSVETTGIELVQPDAGNTVSGLQDLCQGKVDLFGANREAMPEVGCPELEKFEVARYLMLVFINKNNPSAAEIQKNPLTNQELTKLLIDAYSWRSARGNLGNGGTVTRHYLPLESGEFEIVKDGLFPDTTVFNIAGLTTHLDKQVLIDSVAEDANAIGIVDYASFQSYENKNQLIVLPVNGVYASSAITEDNSTYPLMATLSLYTGKHAYENNQTLRSFINYYLSHELDFLDDLGYLYPGRKGYTGNRDTVP